MSDLIDRLPPVRGRLVANADIAKGTWFRVGGPADVLFKPEDEKDLSDFLAACPSDIPITVLGLCSNLIIRDGGIRGVVIKMGREFSDIDHDRQSSVITAGGAALDINVARYGAQNGLGGLEFFSGIPGSIGGAVRMNAGAYGAETVDVLIDARAMDRDGSIHNFTVKDMNMGYRHNGLPSHYIFVSARFKTINEPCEIIQGRIDEIRVRRNDSQPVKERTGGSTFANPSVEDLREAGLPEGTKAWQLIDKVNGRGLVVGHAQMSEKHCNFMLNLGKATASDLENLGEEIRKRVFDEFGLMLRWEIKRIGDFPDDFKTKGSA